MSAPIADGWQQVTLSAFASRLRLARDEAGDILRAGSRDLDDDLPEYLCDYGEVTNWHMLKDHSLGRFVNPFGYQVGSKFFVALSHGVDAHKLGPFHDKDGHIAMVCHLRHLGPQNARRVGEIQGAVATTPWLRCERYQTTDAEEGGDGSAEQGSAGKDPLIEALRRERHRPWKLVLRQALYQPVGYVLLAVSALQRPIACEYLETVGHELLCTQATDIQDLLRPSDFDGVSLPGSLRLAEIWWDAELPLAHSILLDANRPRAGSFAKLLDYLRGEAPLEHYLASGDDLRRDPFESSWDIFKRGSRKLRMNKVEREELADYVLSRWSQPSIPDMLLGLVQELRWRRRWPMLRMVLLHAGGRARAAEGSAAAALPMAARFLSGRGRFAQACVMRFV